MIKRIISNEYKEQSYIREIVDGASELSVECQEYLLEVMRGMVFTRKLVQKEIN